jgi:hypothetical protein
MATATITMRATGTAMATITIVASVESLLDDDPTLGAIDGAGVGVAVPVIAAAVVPVAVATELSAFV